MEGRFGLLAKGAVLAAFQSLQDPVADLVVGGLGHAATGRGRSGGLQGLGRRNGRRGGGVRICGGGGGGSRGRFFVDFGDGRGLVEGREPSVLQQHGVGGTQVGDLVQTASDKIARDFGVVCGGEVGGFAVDDGLEGVGSVGHWDWGDSKEGKKCLALIVGKITHR